MKRLSQWLSGIFLFVTAVFFASQARSLRRRSESITQKEVKELSKTKDQNLSKAEMLGKKADVAFTKAKKAKERSHERIKKLEDKDETTLAERARRFNDSL